jgi:hypothetical protein
LSLFATHDFYRVCMAGFPTNIVTAGVSVMRAELDAATSSSVDMQEAQWRAGVNRQAQPEAAAHQQQQAAQGGVARQVLPFECARRHQVAASRAAAEARTRKRKEREEQERLDALAFAASDDEEEHGYTTATIRSAPTRQPSMLGPQRRISRRWDRISGISQGSGVAHWPRRRRAAATPAAMARPKKHIAASRKNGSTATNFGFGKIKAEPTVVFKEHSFPDPPLDGQLPLS